MEITEKEKLLAEIEHQESSSILGGMEEEYEALENDGFITINRDAAQHSATITQAGRVHLEQLRRSV
jgi:hemerythrin-like domain-containing protein